MITKDMLSKYANDLMFKMNDDEYSTLESEFEIILKQMQLISKIDGLGDVCPMTYPFDLELDDTVLREDDFNNEICFNDMKINVKEYENDMVKVPKVVE